MLNEFSGNKRNYVQKTAWRSGSFHFFRAFGVAVGGAGLTTFAVTPPTLTLLFTVILD